jgi:chemotaxis signal transduction protein
MTDALIPAEIPEGYLPIPGNPAAQRVVPCRINGRIYGIPVEQAGDIVILTTSMPVAFAPPTVRGVFNQNGRMATIVEAQIALGGPTPASPSLVGLTVDHQGHRYVLAVDEVREITELDDEAGEIAPLDIGAIVEPKTA